MTFIPAGEHQQKLWSTLRAIKVVKSVDTWKAALQEAVYQYNTACHQARGFSPQLLHHGYEHAGPGLLCPKGVPADPPLNTPEDKIKFTKTMQQVRKMTWGIVLKNQQSDHRRAEKYYIMRTVNLPLYSWVWVYNPRASPPEGDKLDNRKLGFQLAGSY